MNTPRSSSNGFLAIVCLGILAICGYKVYQDRLERERLAGITPAPAPTQRKPIEHAIAVTRVIEPHYVDLFADLNKDRPMDLVPVMTITRERIRDKHAAAEGDKKAVYDLAVKVLDAMISAGEERTQALESILKADAQPRTALETGRTVNTSNQLFLNSQIKRSSESLKRRKPSVENLFAQLRTAERNWNTHLPKNAPLEIYEIPSISHPVITVEANTRDNSLEQKAYGQRRAVYPWRRTYYDRYGYPQGY
jgi:hypothetical protein